MPVLADSQGHAPPRVRWWQWEGTRRERPVPEAKVPEPGPPAARPRRPASAWSLAGRGPRWMAVATVASTVAWIPGLDVGSWVTELAVALAIGAAGLPWLVRRAGRADGRPAGERLCARLLLGWVGVGLLATLHAPYPWLSITGKDGASAGWLFMAAAAGWWALGTTVGARGRALVEQALVAGAVANGVVALLQCTVGLGALGLPSYSSGQPVGFQGNPVFLGGLEAAAVVLLLVRASERRRPLGWVALGVCAVGTGVAAERLSMGLVALAAAASAAVAARSWWAARHPRLRSGVAVERRRWTTPVPGRAWASGAAALAGLGLGAVLPSLVGRNELTAKLSATAEGTFGDRLHAWLEGLRAVAHQPLLGAGPGRFQAATQHLFPVWFARSHPGQVFTDGHDLVVEYAVTTGVVGACLLVAWLAASFRGRRGALAAAAGVLLAVELVEPLNPVVTPLLFLCLGAAAPRADDRRADDRRADEASAAVPAGAAPRADDRSADKRRPRGRSGAVRVAAVVSAVVGLLVGADLVAGTRALVVADQHRLVADLPAATADTTLAGWLLPGWSQPASEHALIALAGRQATPAAPLPMSVALHWQQVAARRDAANPATWDVAAQLALRLRDLPLAAADARTALDADPWDPMALQALGDVALARGDRPAARSWFAELVTVRPLPRIDQLMAGACAGGAGGTARALVTGACR